MTVMPKTQGLQTLERVQVFLDSSEPLGFKIPHREAG